jgi:hypothetical protein
MRGQEECMQRGGVFAVVAKTPRGAPVMSARSMAMAFLDQAERERGEIWHQGGGIDPERGSRETARLTATSTLVDDDLPL